jgi:NTE family protein
MLEHWDSGLADMTETLHDPRWIGRDCSVGGVHVFDLSSDTPVVR